MKTAVSIPDTIFEQAERLARRRGTSRSRLYSEALADYLARHQPDQVTARLDAVCRELGDDAAIDPFVDRVGRAVLQGTEWS